MTLTDVRHESCGQVAFRVRDTVANATNGVGVILSSASIASDDGRVLRDDDGAAVDGDLIRCQACGVALSEFMVVGEEFVARSFSEPRH